MREDQMAIIADLITKVAENVDSDTTIEMVRKQSLLLCSGFPVPDHFIIPNKSDPSYMNDHE